MTSLKEMKLVKGLEIKNLIGRIRPFPQKTQETFLPNTDEKLKSDENFPETNPVNENDAQNSPNKGNDIIVPQTSENDTRNESLSPREGNYNLRPNPNPNYSEDYRY